MTSKAKAAGIGVGLMLTGRTFEPSKNFVGMQPTVEEVQQYDEVRIHYRKKCTQCHAYLSKGTVSIFCLKCSKKRIDIS